MDSGNIYLLILVLTLSLGIASAANDTCGPDEFSCGNGTNICLPIAKKCDNNFDCPNATDETSCTTIENCPEGQQRCSDGQCHNNCGTVLFTSLKSSSEISTQLYFPTPTLTVIPTTSQYINMATSDGNNIMNSPSTFISQTTNIYASLSISDYSISTSPSANLTSLPSSELSFSTLSFISSESVDFAPTSTNISSGLQPLTTSLSFPYYESSSSITSEDTPMAGSSSLNDVSLTSWVFSSIGLTNNELSSTAPLTVESSNVVSISSMDIKSMTSNLVTSVNDTSSLHDVSLTTSYEISSMEPISEKSLVSSGVSMPSIDTNSNLMTSTVVSLLEATSSASLLIPIESYSSIPATLSEIASSADTTTSSTTTEIIIINVQSMLSDVIVGVAIAGLLLLLIVVGSVFVIKYAKFRRNKQNPDGLEDELCSSETYSLNAIDFSARCRWHFREDPNDPF